MKTAADLMTKNPDTFQSGQELREVTTIFLNHKIASAPVVTPFGETLGVLTELGVIRAFLRLHLKEDKHTKVIHHKDLLTPATFVSEDAPLTEVVEAMIKSKTHRVLVQNASQRLTGIISPKDVITFLIGEDKAQITLKDQLRLADEKLKALTAQVTTLKDSLHKYHELFEDNPAMVHSVDANGHIVMANRRIHEVLGYEPGEMLNLTMYDIYSENVHGEAEKGLKTVMETGSHKSVYSTMITKTGQKIRVDLASSALRDPSGKFMGSISVSRQVDSEALLRALHGGFSRDTLTTGELSEILDRIEED
ncbi:MAG: PAS domain S-box protein [Pseudobdellovibrionaceae bacterium]|nr:MAG: PAS domain S-box protein [Pseudobdellovibrionaceae bacterium]